jgi:hypothetical protein
MASGCGWGTSATTSGPGVNSASNGGQSLANGAAAEAGPSVSRARRY